MARRRRAVVQETIRRMQTMYKHSFIDILQTRSDKHLPYEADAAAPKRHRKRGSLDFCLEPQPETGKLAGSGRSIGPWNTSNTRSKAAMHPDPFVDHIRDVPKRCIRISVLRARRAERSSAMLPAMKGDWEIRQILRRDTTITSTFEPSGTAVKRTPLTCWEASEG